MENVALVVGGRGLIGSAVSSKLTSQGANVYRTYSRFAPREKNWRHLDLTKEETISSTLKRVKPDTVYICAAYTNVDRCQENEQAEQINLYGTAYLIGLCKKMGIYPVFFSSSYVFDGVKKSPYTEEDMPRPINDYGLWKMEMEGYVLDADGLVVRTVGVFGSDNKNFMSQILSLKKYDSLHVPDDQYMNPIWVADLARITVQLVGNRDGRATGIFHVAGNTNLSKFDWAKSILISTNRWNEGKVYPSYGARQQAKRPENGCLDTSKLNYYGIETPDFHKGIIEAVTW